MIRKRLKVSPAVTIFVQVQGHRAITRSICSTVAFIIYKFELVALLVIHEVVKFNVIMRPLKYVVKVFDTSDCARQ